MRASVRVSIFGFIVWGLQAESWTEQETIRRFLEQNPVVRETRARQEIARMETRGRTLLANPVAGLSREGAGHTEFYQVSQVLPTSGRLPLLRQAGAAQVAALDAEGEGSLWVARCSLRMAFYRAVASQQRRQLWRAAAGDLTRTIGILTLREKEGEGSRLDRLRAEREQTELLASQLFSDAEWEQSRAEVLSFLPAGGFDAVEGSLETTSPTADLDTAIAAALARRGDLRAERHRQEQMRREQQAAERLRIPEPVVNAGLKRADVGPRLEAGPVAGVTWALPLFNRGKAEVARYSAERERIAARIDQLSRRVRASIEGAWRTFELRRAGRTQYAEAQGVSTDEILRISMVAYQEGEIGILQLLDAFRLQRESRLRQIDLALAAKEAQISLELQLGEEFSQ